MNANGVHRKVQNYSKTTIHWYGSPKDLVLPIVQTSTPAATGGYSKSEYHQKEVVDHHSKAQPIHSHIANQLPTVLTHVEKQARVVEMWNLEVQDTKRFCHFDQHEQECYRH